jgi:hypothetical protein
VIEMAKTLVIRSSSEILGIKEPVGSERCAGYVPIAASHRCCRVTVRKDGEKLWTVYAVAFKGDTKLATWEILQFPCENCATAFALDLVFGDGYASCIAHERSSFHEGDTFAGRVAMLCCLMGIDKATYNSLTTGSIHRIAWVVSLISDKLWTWQYVVRAWEFAENFASQRGLSLDSAISTFYAEAVKGAVYR